MLEGSWNNYGVNLHEISWDSIDCRRIGCGNSIFPYLGLELETTGGAEQQGMRE